MAAPISLRGDFDGSALRRAAEKTREAKQLRRLLALAARRSKSLEVLSAAIAWLKDAWGEEHACGCKRDLSSKRYIYFWADGIYVQAMLEDEAQCLLVIIGATPQGKKKLVGLVDGVRQSAQSWRELLLDLKRRGLAMGPELGLIPSVTKTWG